MYKYITQHFLNYSIHYWRTKSGAEVDFVVYKNDGSFIPVEVKYRGMSTPGITRGYRSFLQAYQPKQAVVITKDFIGSQIFEGVPVEFIPLAHLTDLLNVIGKM